MSASRVTQFLSGYWHSQAIYVAAKLGVADRLHGGPRTAAELAGEVGAHAPSLYRLLRALSTLQLFREDEAHRFHLLPDGEALRSDVPGSQRALAIMMGEEHFAAWGELLYSVRTGESAFEKVFGEPLFEFLSQHPEQASVFDKAMVSVHGHESAEIVAAYDWSPIGALCDVGGGNGSLLQEILAATPHLEGIVFDLPHVVERARERLATTSVAERVRTVGGSFFEHIPPGMDTILMRHIIHDWDDAECAAILKTCRAALPSTGRLLIVESVIEPGNEPSFAKWLDLTMLAIPGGQERTRDEYAKLLRASGFELQRVLPTAGSNSILEATLT